MPLVARSPRIRKCHFIHYLDPWDSVFYVDVFYKCVCYPDQDPNVFPSHSCTYIEDSNKKVIEKVDSK